MLAGTLHLQGHMLYVDSDAVAQNITSSDYIQKQVFPDQFPHEFVAGLEDPYLQISVPLLEIEEEDDRLDEHSEVFYPDYLAEAKALAPKCSAYIFGSGNSAYHNLVQTNTDWLTLHQVFRI